MKAEHVTEEQTIELPLSDQQEWGQSQSGDVPVVIIRSEQQRFGDALKAAWPYIRAIFSIFIVIVLAVNVAAWTTLNTPDRWAWVLMTIFMVFVAHEKGARNKHIQYLFFSAVALVTALWI